MANVSKAEYLKRYLSGPETKDTKRKKKKKPKIGVKESKLRIFDDDIDLAAVAPTAEETEAKEEELMDDAPTIADMIDERPEHVKQLEAYRQSNRWKTLEADEAAKKLKELAENGIRGKSRHDSDSDNTSPPRKKRHDSDSDASPPRKKRHDSDSNASPPRNKRHDSDSDASPPRKKRHELDSDALPPRKNRHDSDSDASPPRKNRHDSDSDASPPRKNRHDSDSDASPPRKNRHDSDSDQSPPRKTNKKTDKSSGLKGSKKSTNQDFSPPRRRTKSDSDESPPRRKRRDLDSDSSPPRRKTKDSESNNLPSKSSGKSREKSGRKSRWEDSSKVRSEEDKMKKTLGGAKAGLSSAKEMRDEMAKLKAKEDEAFSKIDAKILGKNAETVVRGKKKTKQEEDDEAAAAEKQKKKMEVYSQWGKGLAQQEEQNQRTAEALHEVAKPLARYRDDEDLDSMLKAQDREGDPMLAFIKKKKVKESKKEKPMYKGPEPPPNRFNIRPGFRWDGVDRSSGFEKQFFQKISDRKATKDVAYKWSVEEM